MGWLQSIFRLDGLGPGMSLYHDAQGISDSLEGQEETDTYMPIKRSLVPSSRQTVRCLLAMSARDCIRLGSTQVGPRVFAECRTC